MSPASEVQAREPGQRDVAGPLAVDPFRIREALDEVRQRLRHPEIPPGDSPHQHEEEQPEAECAVQVPVDAAPAGAPLDPEAALPSSHTGPPDDEPGDDEEREDQTEQAVPPWPVRPVHQQFVVQADGPQDEELSLRGRIAKVLTGIRVEESLLLLPIPCDRDQRGRIGKPVATPAAKPRTTGSARPTLWRRPSRRAPFRHVGNLPARIGTLRDFAKLVGVHRAGVLIEGGVRGRQVTIELVAIYEKAAGEA